MREGGRASPNPKEETPAGEREEERERERSCQKLDRRQAMLERRIVVKETTLLMLLKSAQADGKF